MEVGAEMRYDHGSGFSIAIDDSSQVGEARRNAAAMAAAVGLSATDAGKFAILATEAATNIAKHAGRGEIVLRSLDPSDVRGVELVAIDNGPGISDLDRALKDGYSTAGSPGAGLGAVSRLATRFDIYTIPDAGTVLVARIEAEPAASGRPRTFDVGVVRAAKRGELECGDDWGIVYSDSGSATLTVADGLGHGHLASEASRRAVEVAAEHSAESPTAILSELHAGLRTTRGAALAVAQFDSAGSTLQFAGVGNIAAAVVSPRDSKSLVSHNGISGHEMRKVQEFSYDWPSDALLVVHSDGVSSRWDLDRYPGLAIRDPSVVAGVIYRDFSRGRDDALVVVVRRKPESVRLEDTRWR
jgi:anti-sigma regulatory factor (Ser/Thr protein kinase)